MKTRGKKTHANRHEPYPVGERLRVDGFVAEGTRVFAAGYRVWRRIDADLETQAVDVIRNGLHPCLRDKKVEETNKAWRGNQKQNTSENQLDTNPWGTCLHLARFGLASHEDTEGCICHRGRTQSMRASRRRARHIRNPRHVGPSRPSATQSNNERHSQHKAASIQQLGVCAKCEALVPPSNRRRTR
jgi:hypothetical protein